MTPLPASTVVLLRDALSAPEVFMVRRHEGLAFMGGAYVFPGGRVDEADRVPSDPDGYRVAAIRELFEEGGVLLASDSAGNQVSLADEDARARFEEHRRSVLSSAATFHEMIEGEHLTLDLEALVLCAHWVTPPRMSRRFDTLFFAARVPAGQAARHDAGETIESVWIGAAGALSRASAGQMDLPPPTRHTLEALEKFSSVRDILGFYRGRAIERHTPQ